MRLQQPPFPIIDRLHRCICKDAVRKRQPIPEFKCPSIPKISTYPSCLAVEQLPDQIEEDVAAEWVAGANPTIAAVLRTLLSRA
jgi:hypothetical protein